MVFKQGNIPHNKGIKGIFKHNEESKQLIRLTHLGKLKSEEHKDKLRIYRKMHPVNNIGEKNGMWKGDNATYTSLHQWVRRHKIKFPFCECCGTLNKKVLDLANISGLYKRDTNDYEWLCRSCHTKIDNKMQKQIKKFGHPSSKKSLIQW